MRSVGAASNAIRGQCNDTDRATAALLSDLADRGLLDEKELHRSGGYERLYDLSVDEMELHDLKERHADRFRAMKAEYEAWAATMLPYKEEFL